MVDDMLARLGDIQESLPHQIPDRHPPDLKSPVLSPNPPTNSFEKLLGHIRKQRSEKQKAALESEEWEEILNLDLTSEVGHLSGKKGCRKHWHFFYHVHTATGISPC